MPINNLHHFTIRTRDIEKPSVSFQYIFGFGAGFTPEIDVNFPFVCLYRGEKLVVHIVGRDPHA